jgi:hypothetical protein
MGRAGASSRGSLSSSISPTAQTSARPPGTGSIDIHTARTDRRPAHALLIRPDAHIAWAATTGAPADTAAIALREALSCWFGTPMTTAATDLTSELMR